MENILYNVAIILARFDFAIADYHFDGGERVKKQAIDYYKNHCSKYKEEDVSFSIRRYIDSRYEQMKRDSINWDHVIPVLFSGDTISFNFQGTVVSGIVSVSPKKIGITMKEPFDGLYDESIIHASAPVIFTLDLEEGSPANSEGIICARNMLEHLYFDHIG